MHRTSCLGALTLPLLVVVSACGGDGPQTEVSGSPIATLEVIRGEGSWQRLALSETTIEGPALARLRFDSGPRVLLRNARFSLREDGMVLESGDAFADVAAGDRLELVVGEHTLVLQDARVSADGEGAYVVRGEVAHRRGDARHVVAGGQQIRFADDAISAVPLWNDWTGGLAQPGPGLRGETAIGALEGRVPDEVGQARWPLTIRRLDVRVRIVDDLAITEVDQVFFNPASEAVEGIYRVRVPESAVLSRFAVDRDGRMVDGYVREKAQARRAYQQQVYRGSTLDPALLEWTAPGAYKARIYPIAPGAERRITIRYAEWLHRSGHVGEDGARVYRYPMVAAGDAPHIEELAIEVDVEGAHARRVVSGHAAEFEDQRVRVRQSDVRPRADFVLELDDEAARPDQVAWRAPHEAPLRDPRAGAMPDESEDDYLFVPLVLPERLFEGAQRNEGLDLVVVADVSAGTARHELELGRSFVESIAAHLGEGDRIAIVASDVGLREDAELGDASDERVRGLLDRLAREPSGGASDLGLVLEEASALVAGGGRQGAVIYVGDGAPTVGEVGAEELLQRIERLPEPLRAYAIAIGEESALELLESITRGGGLAMRVETQPAGAEAALRVLAHLRAPVAQRVRVEVEGAEQVFPRRAVDVAQGAVLPVVGRAPGDAITTLRVRGEIAGEPFDETIALSEQRAFDEGDLRLRWAGERLQQLLLSGGRREEVADLGVRYGLITPFTSFYVPSAAEMASLGDAAPWSDTMMARRIQQRHPRPLPAALVPALALLSTTGCTFASEEAPMQMPVGASADSVPADEVSANRYAMEEPTEEEGEWQRNQPVATATPAAVEAAPAEPEAEPEPDESAAAFGPGNARGSDPMTAIGALAERDSNAQFAQQGDLDDMLAAGGEDQGESSGFGGLALRGSGRGGGGTGEGTIGLGNLGTIGHGAGGATGGYEASDAPSSMSRRSPPGPGRARRARRIAPAREEGRRRGESNNRLDVSTEIRTGSHRLSVTVRSAPSVTHVARRCSDASRAFLDARRELWRERLGAANGVSGFVSVYTRADRACELRSWRDRRALLELMLRQAGGVDRRIAMHRMMSGSQARAYLRRAILRSVRTPNDLRAARNYFGRSQDEALRNQVLERAGSGAGRVRALRQLIAQFPADMDLKLMLLETLEQLERTEQAKRLARILREDPLTDPGVRTAIGEMYLRFGEEAEARRVFGEIVEFAPDDALARRRLGDLFRAHGWFEDAYRQYETLATITPDDPSVLLLLAAAAAGAGRVNEALGLEQRAAETSAPGQSVGIARTALLWSSVRFAELRKAARDEGDEDALRALASRMRRTGVLREASQLRATLVWSHPEADLALYASHPGLRPSRPNDLSPEFGLEAFDVPEQEDGTYQIEVRRAAADTRRGHVTAQNAKLVVVWNEGSAEEAVEIVALRFEGNQRTRAFTINGSTLTEVNR